MARFEVLHPIMKDGEVVRDGLIELEDDSAKVALERGIVRALPEALSESEPNPKETSGTANQQTSNDPSPPDKEMVELFGGDLAGDLQRGGYTSVEEVRGASEEELTAVKGIGSKSVGRIRAALGEGRAVGG